MGRDGECFQYHISFFAYREVVVNREGFLYELDRHPIVAVFIMYTDEIMFEFLEPDAEAPPSFSLQLPMVLYTVRKGSIVTTLKVEHKHGSREAVYLNQEGSGMLVSGTHSPPCVHFNSSIKPKKQLQIVTLHCPYYIQNQRGSNGCPQYSLNRVRPGVGRPVCPGKRSSPPVFTVPRRLEELQGQRQRDLLRPGHRQKFSSAGLSGASYTSTMAQRL